MADALLQEDGTFLLQEDGFKILLEQQPSNIVWYFILQ